jgi:hypothetical protein
VHGAVNRGATRPSWGKEPPANRPNPWPRRVVGTPGVCALVDARWTSGEKGMASSIVAAAVPHGGFSRVVLDHGDRTTAAQRRRCARTGTSSATRTPSSRGRCRRGAAQRRRGRAGVGLPQPGRRLSRRRVRPVGRAGRVRGHTARGPREDGWRRPVSRCGVAAVGLSNGGFLALGPELSVESVSVPRDPRRSGLRLRDEVEDVVTVSRGSSGRAPGFAPGR